MKKRRLFYVVCIVLVFVMTATACAGKSMNETATPSTEQKSSANYSYDRDSSGGTAAEGEISPEEKGKSDAGADNAPGAGSPLNNTSSIENQSTNIQSQDKIIRTFFMQVETQEFDTLISKLDSEINRLSGYVETSKISGRSYLSSDGVRSASITARIPKDSVDEFVSAVGERANVIDKQESTENVTLQYTDIESRKKSLEIEQDRLFALLEKTDTMENIVTLESRLSDIRYELQNYETTLRTYDNKVQYSTVTLNIQEVEIFTPKAELKQTVGTRISNGFNNTIYHISEGAKNFFVWFIVNLPYLLIWGVFIAAIVLIIRRLLIKYKNTITPPGPPKDKE